MLDHGFAANIQHNFARQARGAIPRRNDSIHLHVQTGAFSDRQNNFSRLLIALLFSSLVANPGGLRIALFFGGSWIPVH
jgi:hypothetical protein